MRLHARCSNPLLFVTAFLALKQMARVSSTAIPIGPGSRTFQSSVLDDNEGHLVIDGNATSCARTGWENIPWFTIDLGTSQNVTSVTVIGENTVPNLQIHVGDVHDDVGFCDGHQHNNLCAAWWHGPVPIDTGSGMDFRCEPVSKGRYVTVGVTSTSWPVSLSLCDVAIKG